MLNNLHLPGPGTGVALAIGAVGYAIIRYGDANINVDNLLIGLFSCFFFVEGLNYMKEQYPTKGKLKLRDKEIELTNSHIEKIKLEKNL